MISFYIPLTTFYKIVMFLISVLGNGAPMRIAVVLWFVRRLSCMSKRDLVRARLLHKMFVSPRGNMVVDDARVW